MKRYMSKRASFGLLFSVLALAMVLGGSVARADTLALGSQFGYTTVIMDGAGPNGPYTSPTEVSEGAGPIGPSTLNGSALAFVYCVDLFDEVSVPGTYNALVTSNGTVNGAAVNNAGEIAWLLDNYGAAAGSTPGTPGSSIANEQQALQAAIWSVEYDTSTFRVTGDSSQSYYSDYTTMMGSLSTAPTSDVYWFTPGGSTTGPYMQGLVGGDDSLVTEPASILLLGTMLLGVLHLLKRKLAPSQQ